MDIINISQKLLKLSNDDVSLVTKQTLKKIILNDFLIIKEDKNEKND